MGIFEALGGRKKIEEHLPEESGLLPLTPPLEPFRPPEPSIGIAPMRDHQIELILSKLDLVLQKVQEIEKRLAELEKIAKE